MGLVSNERGSLGVENEACWLTASRESHIHLTLLDLVYVSVGRHCEEVAILILSRAVKGNCHLEEFLKVGWLSRYHF
jgi:hypothetical protein